MEVSEKLKTMIEEDIKKCNDYFTSNGEESKIDAMELFDSLKTKYLDIIPSFSNGIKDHIGMSGGMRRRTIDGGLSSIKSKLEVFVANDYKGIIDKKSSRDININNTINNTNAMEIDINIKVEQIIKNIQNNDYFTEKETEEIIDKVREISDILKQQVGRKEKWGKLKFILVWLAEKGVDVAVQLLPLIFAGIK